MIVIVGLGNPGRQYEGTRHNVGFEVIDLLSSRNQIPVNKIKFKALVGEGFIGNQKVLLVKPQTYMNLSGQSLLEIMNFYKLDSQQIIVVYDDIDIETGKLRIRAKGSAGTHNGMRSIIYEIQTDDFPRVRIGIGKPRFGDLADYVLGRLVKEERELVSIALRDAAEAVEVFVKQDIQTAMNQYNK
ncbi:peptidyl-tRNA hydrolase [Geosporobacter subterraneus DSM 17957]|uniref:Peptidyl-tRNA hydrolase n=1 Tax=Geosporobacter subterraneus DSM 17957 TaxID=1121919 RepID=A0A1M6FGH8_9FIRM|nr:aminoacyl-tRNA hydrolase [Geosporobacter subterraneus]SHI96756.1 peptidyl-tRNA hydrolase [Geosporobacter subterraneus DSM 17957]